MEGYKPVEAAARHKTVGRNFKLSGITAVNNVYDLTAKTPQMKTYQVIDIHFHYSSFFLF